jgi:hypothetical protein
VRLRDNLVATVVGSAVAAVAAIATAPLVYRYLGPDAYGLVGAYLLIQGLMPLFDGGATAGVARAAAWYRGRGEPERAFLVLRDARRLVGLLAIAFFVVALMLRETLTRHWVGSTSLGESDVQISVACMFAALALRLPMLVDRAALMGLERQVVANAVQAIAAVARTLVALAVALASDTGVVGYFAFQILISLLEWLAYRRLLGMRRSDGRLGRDEASAHIRFSLSVASLSAAWILASHADRIVLAAVLPLSEYGTYSLGVHLASAVVLAGSAMQGAILPRLTRLVSAAEGDAAEALFGMATAASLALALGTLVAVVSAILLVAPSLRGAQGGEDPAVVALLYGIGNIAVVLLAQGYQLQNAHGSLSLHAWTTGTQFAIQLPLLAWVASSGSAHRTAAAYAMVSWVVAATWFPRVSIRFLPHARSGWLGGNVCRPMLTGGVVAAGCLMLAWRGGPSGAFAVALVIAAGMLTTAATVLGNPALRRAVGDGMRRGR